jgi:hypothetical protein
MQYLLKVTLPKHALGIAIAHERPGDVRCWGYTEKYLLFPSISHFDPKQTLGPILTLFAGGLRGRADATLFMIG